MCSLPIFWGTCSKCTLACCGDWTNMVTHRNTINSSYWIHRYILTYCVIRQSYLILTGILWTTRSFRWSNFVIEICLKKCWEASRKNSCGYELIFSRGDAMVRKLPMICDMTWYSIILPFYHITDHLSNLCDNQTLVFKMVSSAHKLISHSISCWHKYAIGTTLYL